ncbi:hypothetical protein ACDF64_02750 [Agromyces sp. MMS24-JH15]|uniref:hypothetical protein n=1 Tax=Agromyces sp. MMS24-JH15 TaxID=3243765 RepID=UPI003749CEEE
MTETKAVAARGAAFWICYALVLIGAIVSVWYTIADVVAVGGFEQAGPWYAASRSVAIVVVAMIAPLFRSDDALLAVAVVLTIVQGIDAFVSATQGDTVRTIASAAFCLVTIIGATFLARSDRVRGRG